MNILCFFFAGILFITGQKDNFINKEKCSYLIYLNKTFISTHNCLKIHLWIEESDWMMSVLIVQTPGGPIGYSRIQNHKNETITVIKLWIFIELWMNEMSWLHRSHPHDPGVIIANDFPESPRVLGLITAPVRAPLPNLYNQITSLLCLSILSKHLLRHWSWNKGKNTRVVLNVFYFILNHFNLSSLWNETFTFTQSFSQTL